MTEVLILGMLVALVKLAHIATVVPGVALWAFGAVMVMLAATAAAFDPREVWARISAARGGSGAHRDGVRTSGIGIGADRCTRRPLRLSRLRPAVESGGAHP
jgi:paraquat-inducible protein A